MYNFTNLQIVFLSVFDLCSSKGGAENCAKLLINK